MAKNETIHSKSLKLQRCSEIDTEERKNNRIYWELEGTLNYPVSFNLTVKEQVTLRIFKILKSMKEKKRILCYNKLGPGMQR